jgi:[ribosomal protein S18]-alanine N-acetyltransferase
MVDSCSPRLLCHLLGLLLNSIPAGRGPGMTQGGGEQGTVSREKGTNIMSMIDAITKARLRVYIRWMIRRDMPEVLAIEHSSFDFPWCEEEFLRVLRQRNCIGMVAEYGERVVGFMIYELHKAKLQVLNFAVHPEFRRRGEGRQMVAKLVSQLSSYRRTRIALHVRESSLPAQHFWAAMGFRAEGVEREFYEDTGEDAYRMQYLFNGS